MSNRKKMRVELLIVLDTERRMCQPLGGEDRIDLEYAEVLVGHTGCDILRQQKHEVSEIQGLERKLWNSVSERTTEPQKSCALVKVTEKGKCLMNKTDSNQHTEFSMPRPPKKNLKV